MNIEDSPQFEVFYVIFAYLVILIGFTAVAYDLQFLGLGLSIVECFKKFQDKIKNLNLKSVNTNNFRYRQMKTLLSLSETQAAFQKTPNRNSLKIGDLVKQHNELIRHGKLFCECFQLAALVRFLTVGGSICILGHTILEVTFFSF